MSVNHLDSELVAYHFGTVTPDERTAIELHLTSCAECVRKFVELKRQIEAGEGEPLPSQASRDTLRSAVAAEMGLTPRRARAYRWWERPVAFTVASAAIAASVGVVYSASISDGVAPRAVVEVHQQPK